MLREKLGALKLKHESNSKVSRKRASPDDTPSELKDVTFLEIFAVCGRCWFDVSSHSQGWQRNQCL